MSGMAAAYGRFLVRYRWIALLVSVLWVMAAASGGRFLHFTTDYRVFFSGQNPQLLAFEALERTYNKNDNVIFVLTPKDGNVFTVSTLQAIKELTEKSWKIPYSLRVDSITNFQHTSASEDELTVADLVQNPGHLSPTELAKIRDIAINEPLLRSRLIAPDGAVTSVSVTIQLPQKNEMVETPTVVKYARDLAAEMRQQYPNLEVRLTGMVFMNNAFSEASQNDMKSLVPISFAAMLVCLGLLIRGFSGTVGTFFVILFSIVAAMGSGGYLGFPITPPSASAPIIILTVAIADCVHIAVTFLHEMRNGRAKHEAMVESLRVNMQPVFLTSVTTAIGFATMNFSEVPPFQHLGNIVAFGVLYAWILAITFFPALLCVLPVKVRPIHEGTDKSMLALGNFVVRNRKALFWGVTLVTVGLVASIPRNQLNDVFVHYFDQSIPFRVDSDYMTEHLTGLYIIDYSLESGEPGGISNPAFLAEVDAFTKWYRQQPETIHVNTLTDTMKRLNKNMHGDDESFYRLPEERELAAQYLLLYEMSLPYGLDLNNQINVDKSATRMTVTLKTISTNEILLLEARAQDWLDKNAPHVKKAMGTGPTIMFAHIGQRNIVSMLRGTILALILISAILILALRSFKIGMISMVPNLVPAAMGFGLWGLLVGEVGLALSVVTSMTLGIVVDDTIHFLSKYLRALRERHMSAADAVRYAFTSVGRALVITSVVLVVGFSILALSSFKLNSGMGALSAIVITFALAADLLLLPPLLMKLEERKDAKRASGDTSPGSVAA